MTYATTDVAVPGGALRVGIWEPTGPAPAGDAVLTVLAVHGVTSSHLAWALVAQQLTTTTTTTTTTAGRIRVLAPDLRGRGRSADLPGPWGFEQHTDDLAAVLEQLGGADLTVGHSMGGFVTVVAGHRHAGRFGKLMLVDGGLPLPLPPDESVQVAMDRVLGPTAARLGRRFPSRAAHLQWWRAHPAFIGVWSPELESYFDYDLAADTSDDHRTGATSWRSSARLDAVTEDFSQQTDSGPVGEAWTSFSRDGNIRDITFLRSPRGLRGELPGLYPPAALRDFADRHPGFSWDEVPGTNHYTVLLDAPGAGYVASVVDRVLRR